MFHRLRVPQGRRASTAFTVALVTLLVSSPSTASISRHSFSVSGAFLDTLVPSPALFTEPTQGKGSLGSKTHARDLSPRFVPSSRVRAHLRRELHQGFLVVTTKAVSDCLLWLGHDLGTPGVSVPCPTDGSTLSDPLREFAYGYDQYGNRNAVAEKVKDGYGTVFTESLSFLFDNRDQLTVAAYSNKAHVYSYDWDGNRKTEKVYPPLPGYQAVNYVTPAEYVTPTTHTFTYNAREHLTQVEIDTGTTSGNSLIQYAYDNAGRTLSRTVDGAQTKYQWNADDTLRKATSPSSVELGNYSYDSSGLRRRKLSSEAAEGERVYLYDGSSLIAELDAVTGQPKLVYIYGTELWGVVDYTSGSPQVQWLHRDGQRSVVERTASEYGQAVRVAGPFRYDAFGNYRQEWATPVADGSTKVGYTGHLWDVETGLVYAKARYYQPELGRWLSQDALEGLMSNAPSLNRYSYVLNNPLRYWDPTGYAPGDTVEDARRKVIQQAAEKKGAVKDASKLTEEQARKAIANQGKPKQEFKPKTLAEKDKEEWLASLEPPETRVAGKEINVFESEKDLQARHTRRKVEAALTGIDIAAREYLKVAAPILAAEAMVGVVGLMVAGLLADAGSTIEVLTSAAARAKTTVGQGRGAVYGTRVHTAFQKEVQALGAESFSTEVSYLNGRTVPHGTAGSVRLDVVEGATEAPTAVYDLKTGSATLTPARIQQIREHIPGGKDVPVIEVR